MGPIIENPNESKSVAMELLGDDAHDDHEAKTAAISQLETKPTGTTRKTTRVTYGTAGFRELVHTAPLSKVMSRTAAFGVLQSLSCGGSAVGVMITASHNDESYNGVKIVHPNGGMIPQSWEERISWIVNHDNLEQLWTWITEQRQEQHKIKALSSQEDDNSSNQSAIVPLLYVGRDTRSHSLVFRDCLIQTAVALGGRVVDLGVVTTPMLHHSVLHANSRHYLPRTLIPPRPYVDGYIELLAYSYVAMCQTIKNIPATTVSNNKTLLVDCACGVGYLALQQLYSKIQSIHPPQIAVATSIQITNGPGMGPLNQNCGSEHVQKQLREPSWYETGLDSTVKDYCASLDGDADRIVFFDAASSAELCLLDGDRISCLLCQFIQGELETLRRHLPTELPELRLGVVQTAYANGASTGYLHDIVGESNVCIAKTGVKHLHAAVIQEQYDIGIYFEANGHGTILFGSNFYHVMSTAQQALVFATSHSQKEDETKPTLSAQTDEALTAFQRLSILPSLVNQAVGDALSDLLLVDAILQIKGWTLEDWYRQQYQDFPSRQLKVRVQDRTMIETNQNETRCLAPSQVQDELDQAMRHIKDKDDPMKAVARCFIRPSGTEDVVRIYAEASTRELADELATMAAAIVHKRCHGIGDLPTL